MCVVLLCVVLLCFVLFNRLVWCVGLFCVGYGDVLCLWCVVCVVVLFSCCCG